MSALAPQATAATFSETTEYRRDLGLTDAVAIVVGRIIGSGIFRTPGPIMALVASTSLFGLVWCLGALVTILAATIYGELVAMMPRAGGPYVYLRMAYGPLWAFLRGWAMFFVAETGAIAAVALVFAEYSGALMVSVGGAPLPRGAVALLALGAVWLLTAVNLFGVAMSGTVQRWLAGLKVTAVVGIIVASALSGGRAANFADPLWPHELSWQSVLAVGAALRYAFFAFSGWEGATYVAEEVRDPRRTLPLSLTLGIGSVLVLYAGTNAAYLYQLSPAAMGKSAWVAVDAMNAALGTSGAVIIAAAVMLNTFGNVSTQILCKARTWQAMARDRLFFARLAPLHARHKTPNAALIAQALWASLLLLAASAAEHAYETVIDFFSATSTLFNLMTLAAVPILRRRFPDADRPYRAWLYPFGLIVVLILYGSFFVLTLATALLPSLMGLGLTSTGLLYYRYLQRNPGEPDAPRAPANDGPPR